jgi:DNA/RNA-binding domain of Phe-tRNA-synthetase-like protein
MSTFQYHADLLARYPNVVGGIILAEGLSNGPTPEALQAEYFAEQKAVLERLGNTPLSQIPALSAWRSAFSAFGVEPTKYRCASEALLRRLTKKGDIPSINTLVDIGNLVSIRYALPVAIFDLREVQGAITVRFADGTERYKPLGEDVTEHPEPGEVIFADDRAMVLARRWCWRQSEESAAQPGTIRAIITVEAHHSSAHADIESARADLLHLLQKYSGGNFVSGIAEKDNLVVSRSNLH